ncbi:MAG TPA: hypothetical protein VK035_00385 [Kiloniellales bacterium]|nr:hypothetical protein [Kiloniellales bacterium]
MRHNVNSNRVRSAPAFMGNANSLFFQLWLQSPLTIAAVVPSSRKLARALAAPVPLDDADGWVVELGPGTGVVTRALLDRGVRPDRLLAVEREPRLAELLVGDLPREVQVLTDDALHLGSLLRARGIGRVAAIVSGIPLVAIPASDQALLLNQAAELLAPGAPFLQFTYGPLAPARRALLQAAGLSAKRESFVPVNFPPASVWSFRRLGGAPS